MNCKYFGYDPESGFEVFETKEQAKDYAQSCIDYERDLSVDGWSEGTSEICWGLITECAKAGEPTKVTDEMRSDNIIGADCEYLVDYTLEGGDEWIPIEEVELEIGGSYWVITETGVESFGVWESAVVYDGEHFGVECDISLEEVSHVMKITKPEA